MSYTVDYSGEKAVQTGRPHSDAPLGLSETGLAPSYRRRGFAVPAIVNTVCTFAVAGVLFFGAEAYAPEQFRPSTATGTYAARVEAAVKAAELEQQTHYEEYIAEVRVSAEQQVERFRAQNQGFLAHYQASLDRGKILAEATARLQSQYVAARISQAQMSQSGDQSIINMTRMFGRLANGLEPGAGNGALSYADGLSNQLSRELTDAATSGVTISVEGWDTGLASTDELRRQFDSIPAIEIPPPPPLETNVDDRSSGRQ